MEKSSTTEMCCPPFDPTPWDDQEVHWEGKRFLQDRVRCLFYVPLGFGRMMTRNMQRIEAAGAKPEEVIVLADTCSPWHCDVFIATTKEVPGARMTTLTGDFECKVFEGPYKDFGKWMKQMKAHLQSKGKSAKKTLAYYTTCPRCAKRLGKNYVVLLAQT